MISLNICVKLNELYFKSKSIQNYLAVWELYLIFKVQNKSESKRYLDTTMLLFLILLSFFFFLLLLLLLVIIRGVMTK